MSHLVTQLVDQQPTLVVVAPHPVPPEILAGWKRTELAIESYTPEKFVKNYAEIAATTYRVVFWLPTLYSETLYSSLQTISTLLQKNQQQLYIVSSFITPIADLTQFWKEWHSTSQRQAEAWVNLQKTTARPIWILGQDVIDLPHQTWTPGLGLTRDLEQANLYDPQLAVYPQSFAGFWRSVFELIVDPTTRSTILQGKKQLTTQVVQRLRLSHQRATGQLAPITPRPATLAAFFDLPTLTLASSLVGEDVVIDKILQQRVKPALSTLPSKNTSRPQLPPSRPLVIPPKPILKPYLHSNIALSEPPPTQLLPSQTVVALPIVPPPVTVVKPHLSPTLTTPTPERKSTLQVSEVSSFDEQVQQVFHQYRQEDKTARSQQLTSQAQKTIKKTRHRKRIFWGGVVAGSLGLFVMLLVGSFWLTSRFTTQHLTTALRPGNFQHILGLSAESTSYRLPNPALIQFWQWQVQAASWVLSEDTLSQSQQTSQLVSELKQIEELKDILNEVSANMYGLVARTDEGDVETQVSLLGTHIQKMYEAVVAAETTTQQLDLQTVAQTTGTSIDQIQSLLFQAKRNLTAAQLLQPLWTRLLGVQRSRTYAILWQNSLELRPSGGFIQAVALVTLENGQVVKTEVLNSYELDKRLAGEVAPPVELQQLLGEKQWFFRDSNWDSDFPQAAHQITTYLDRVSNQPISGIIALTTPSAAELLHLVEPLEVSGYTELVTSENLTRLMEENTQLPTALPAAKMEFQTAVLQALLAKIQALPTDQSPRLAAVLSQEFTDRQLLIALTDPNEAATFQTLGWTGSLPQPVCPAQLNIESCYIESVTQTEANIGVNLANITVQRQVAHQVTLTATAAAHRRQITFTNGASQRKWPRGDYKAYLRLYVPPTANLISSAINGRNLPADQVRQSTQSANQVWGWELSVPVKQQTVVEIQYLTPLPASLITSTTPAYGLLHHYQPGISPVSTSTNFTFPERWSPTLIAPSATVAPQQLQFISPASLHTLQAVQFAADQR